MEFAVNVPTSVGCSEYSTLPRADRIQWDDQRAFTRAIDSLGFDGVAVPDHLMTGGEEGTIECATLLAALAREERSDEADPGITVDRGDLPAGVEQ